MCVLEITPRCRRALNYAEESLSRFGHSHVSSAHLVLGLLALQNGVAVHVLQQFNVSAEGVESYLSARRVAAAENTVWEGVILGKSAALAFERAEKEAQACRHTYLGTEHLLLGILAEESGEAADLFASAHADRESMRGQLNGKYGEKTARAAFLTERSLLA